MSNYIEPKTNWKKSDLVGISDLNKIEKNIKSLKDESNEVKGDNIFSGDNEIKGEIIQSGKVTIYNEIILTGVSFTGVFNSDFNFETSFL